ncbi:MAG: peptidase S41 [SAR324 cluster bacterium]|nr:peptidase S41 [SAR324 cluster bacterium]MBL7035174.1 peptidase S41 [SAR324 cluster bacterium]
MIAINNLILVEFRTKIFRIFVTQKCLNFCLFALFFTFSIATTTSADEKIKALDFSGNGPLFLSNKQIKEDLLQAEHFLQENYVRYSILEDQGLRWKEVFNKLADQLSANKNPTLTHHFQKQLISGLEFTEDSSLQADLFIKKRHYIQRVDPKVAFFTGIRLAQQQERFRVLPTQNQASKIVNNWFNDCTAFHEVFFPILPERQSEELFMLGQQANHQLKPLICEFENDSGEKQIKQLPLTFPEAELNNSEMPVYEFESGRTPYVRWYRDGKSGEVAVKQFYKLARKLQSTRVLILDVRGNSDGSFSFIEKWLKEFTRNNWQNVIVQERQTLSILAGLLNRVQWNLHHASARFLIGSAQLENKRLQLLALIKHFKEQEITEKLVETKFIFNGKHTAPKWNTRLIVLTNQHCGNGCQFLAALSKQLPHGVLIGTNTGPFPKNTSGPIYQLKHSRIMLSFSHRLHLNHLREPVSTSGYLPDYWLFPPMGRMDILRFASKKN